MKTRTIFSRFKPYVWELSNAQIAASVGISASKIVRMDTNASPYLPNGSLVALSRSATKIRVNDYPDTSYLSLRKGLSKYCKRSVDRFVITNGADEALDIVAKTILDPRDEVVIPFPTYSMFRISSEIMGARPIFIRRDKRFGIDVEGIKKRITKRTRIIFLCSPNNPTGNCDSREEVRTLLEFLGDQTVVVDEAYFEFSGKTLADLTDKYDNLVVVRTFSKAFSMAGVRVGYMIASRKSVEKFNIVRPPNSLGVISLFLAENGLKHIESMKKNVRAIISERVRLYEEMTEEKSIEAFPSEANFVLFKVKDGLSKKLHRALMRKGLVLRNLSETNGIESCLRVTVNTRTVNERFLNELRDTLHTIK